MCSGHADDSNAKPRVTTFSWQLRSGGAGNLSPNAAVARCRSVCPRAATRLDGLRQMASHALHVHDSLSCQFPQIMLFRCLQADLCHSAMRRGGRMSTMCA